LSLPFGVVGPGEQDGTMLITPRVGADRTTVMQQLTQVQTDLVNVRSNGTTAQDLFNAYLRWAANAVRLLRYQTREADMESLVLTRRYWTLQAMAGGPVSMARDLVEVEIDDRLAVFEETVNTTRAEFVRWDRLAWAVVADTSFYHQHPEKLDEVDLSKVIQSRDETIGLIVPMVVIDELEKQKRSSDKQLRGRAQVTLAVIERVARDNGAGRLREADFSGIDRGEIPSGETWLDVLFDLPGHVRLPINDDEIVDRALSVQILSGKDVTFLTYDTNQALRARHAGLNNVMHLKHDRATEPN
jgi:PIN domain